MGSKNLDVRMTFVDQFTSGFNKSIKAMTNGSRASQKVWKGVQKSGDAIASAGTKLTAGVTAPIVALGTAAVKNYGDVDKQLRLVQQTMGSTPKQAKQLESAIKSAASASVYSMQDAADASLNFARQGFNAKEAANMLTPALNLAAGTGTDLSSVTAGLGNTLKAFGASSKEASHYSDMFAKAQAQANTDAQGLFDTMGIAGSTAKTVGWSFSDLATLTGVFGDHSVSASEGATALNTGLMRLASPAKQGATAMKSLGINAFDAKGKLKDMPSLMQELNSKFSGLSQQEKLAAASAIFGKQQASKWLTLIGESPSKFSKMKNAIDGTNGTAKSMSDALMNGVGGSIEKLKSTFDVFKYNIGQVAGGAIKGFIDKITALMDKFNNMDDAQKKQILKWIAMAAAVGPAVTVFGKTVSVIGKVGEKFSVLKGIMKGMGLFEGGGGGLASLGSKLTNLPGLGKLFSFLGPKLTGLGSGIVGHLKPVGSAIAGVASKAGGFITRIPVLGKLITGIGIKLKTPTKGFKLLRLAIHGLTSPLGIVIVAIGLAVAAFIAIKTHMAAFRKGMQASNPAIKRLKKSFNDLKTTMKPIMPVLKKIGQIFVQVFSGVIISAVTGAVAIIINVVDTIIQQITGIVKFIKGVVKLIKAIFTGDWKGAFEAGKEVVTGFVQAVTAPIKGIVNIVKDVGKAIKGVFSKIKIPHFSGGGVVPRRAGGDTNWGGGLVQVHERGGEIMDLPGGTRIYPHDQSVAMARKEGSKSITVAKLADSIVVREEADIDRITDMFVRKLELEEANAYV